MTVVIKPKGNSMTPLIKSGQEVLLVPKGHHLAPLHWRIGDIVLVKVKGSVYLHKISAIDGNRIQISNNHGHVNGWTTFDKVYGVAIL